MIPKFRAWDKDAEKMIYQEDNGDDYSWMIGTQDIWIESLDYVDSGKPDQILMQSTGLKDKNGVDIFEGDIVRITSFPGDWYSTIGHVVWGLDEPMSGAYPAFFIPEFESEMNSFSQIFDSGEYEIEVIGNRFENPELLEVEG